MIIKLLSMEWQWTQEYFVIIKKNRGLCRSGRRGMKMEVEVKLRLGDFQSYSKLLSLLGQPFSCDNQRNVFFDTISRDLLLLRWRSNPFDAPASIDWNPNQHSEYALLPQMLQLLEKVLSNWLMVLRVLKRWWSGQAFDDELDAHVVGRRGITITRSRLSHTISVPHSAHVRSFVFTALID